MRRYLVNPIDLEVSEILQYKQTNRQADLVTFYIRNYELYYELDISFT